MQIITGKYRGRKLLSLETEKTRPTLARVKESLFSMVDEYISDKVVLDLFAGSGALGIEALSRNAKKVYFVDSNPDAKKVIETNLRNVKEDFSVEISDYVLALDKYAKTGVKLCKAETKQMCVDMKTGESLFLLPDIVLEKLKD